MGKRSTEKRRHRAEALAAATVAPAGPPRGRRRWPIPLAAVVLALGALAYAGARYVSTGAPAVPVVIKGDGVRGPKGMVWVPGGEFLMGSDHKLAQRNERPAHKVRVHGFWMDQTHVTNAQFAEFVKATGYLTTAERTPDWETLKVQLPPGTPKPPQSALVPGAMVFVGTDRPVSLDDYSQWWAYVPGADWRKAADDQR